MMRDLNRYFTILAALSFVSVTAFANDPNTEACRAARAQEGTYWNAYWTCLEHHRETTRSAIEIDGRACQAEYQAYGNYLEQIREAGLPCEGLTRLEIFGSSVSSAIETSTGGSTAGGGSAVLRIVVSPFRALLRGGTSWNRNPEGWRTEDLLTADFSVRYTDGQLNVDTLRINAIGVEHFIIRHLGITLNENITWDTNRGQVVLNATAAIFLNLLRTAFTSLYPGRHINLGTGARLNIREFYVLPDMRAGGPNQDSGNFQIPISLDVAYSFLRGRLNFRGIIESAINPVRTRDYTVNASAQGLYTLRAAYSGRNQYADYLRYRVSAGVRYEASYQNERASDYGTPTSNILGEQLVQRTLGTVLVEF